MNAQPLVLASASSSRAALLRNTGLEFSIQPAELDERVVERPLLEAGLDGADLAQVLAQAKADHVSAENRSVLTIGADQVMTLDGEVLHKPADMEEARRRLLQLAGKTHQLASAVCIVVDQQLVWSHVDVAHVTFRPLTPRFVGRHLARVGEAALSSVGAYQIEGEGIQLIEKLEGDHFTVIGLPILPLVDKLRELEAIDG